jgi:hypothetical protein
MSITVQDIQTEFNTIIGDASTDRVSSAERLSYITQATAWFKEETSNDDSVSTFDINYYDGINYYKINSAISDYLETNDLRRIIGKNYTSFTNKSSREIVEDIAQGSTECSYSIERRDDSIFLVINHDSMFKKMQVSRLDSLTEDGGTWAVDATNSDATSLSVNTIDFTEGAGSLSFNVDVSQSVNNRATILNTDFNPGSLSDDKDITSFLLDIKFPTITYISSVTFYWGSDSSNYYSVVQTTDMNGNAFITDWQTLEFEWLGATVTGTPDDSNITYFRIDINYTASQADATSFKIDNLRIVRPEVLKFYYTSWNVGTTAAGADIKKYTATTDIPYYSGRYDNYMFPIAQYAASLCFKNLRLYSEAREKEVDALKSVKRIRGIVPSSVTKERKNFKVAGISFNRRGRRSFR